MSAMATAYDSEYGSLVHENFECPPTPVLRTISLPDVSSCGSDYGEESSVEDDSLMRSRGPSVWDEMLSVLVLFKFWILRNVLGLKKKSTTIDYMVGRAHEPFDISNGLAMIIVTEITEYWSMDFLGPADSDLLSVMMRIISFAVFSIFMSTPKTTRAIDFISAYEIDSFIKKRGVAPVVGQKAVDKVREAGIRLDQL